MLGREAVEVITLVQIFKTEHNPDLAQGYDVQIWENGEMIEQYSAGAHPLDSQSLGSSPLKTVREWAMMLEEQLGRKPTSEEMDITECFPEE